MDYKSILGIIGIVISLGSYVPYLRSIIKNETKPHAFSWLVWTFLTGTAFAAALVEHGGIGAWVVGSSALLCLVVFVLALKKGTRHFDRFDWFTLLAAFLSIIVWKFTNDPTFSVVVVTIIDAIGFIPTYRKGYRKPNEENISLYSFSAIKYVFSLFALRSYSLATWLFPASLILTNGVFVVMLIVRRNYYKTQGNG